MLTKLIGACIACVSIGGGFIEDGSLRQESAAKIERIEVQSPLRLDKTRVLTEDQSSDKDKKRYGFTESKDDLEGTTRRALDICDEFRVDLRSKTINTRDWLFRVTTHSDGKLEADVAYVCGSTDSGFSLGVREPLQREQFELIYRFNGERNALKASSATCKATLGLMEVLVWQVEVRQFLDFADSGHLRIKYPEGQIDLKMDAEDVEAIRSYVWECVPGGEELIHARYKLVPRREPDEKK